MRRNDLSVSFLAIQVVVYLCDILFGKNRSMSVKPGHRSNVTNDVAVEIEMRRGAWSVPIPFDDVFTRPNQNLLVEEFQIVGYFLVILKRPPTMRYPGSVAPMMVMMMIVMVVLMMMLMDRIGDPVDGGIGEVFEIEVWGDVNGRTTTH